MVTYRCYRVCVSKPWLPAGETFKKWIENPRNMYIGPNLSKYSGGSLIDSEWSPTEIFQKHKDLSIASNLFYYEKWVREEKMDNILQLAGMKLGCFCLPTQICHGDVLMRLIIEEMSRVEEDFDTLFQPLTITSPKPQIPATKRRLFDDGDDKGLSPMTKVARTHQNLNLNNS